jgi:hypothetical protein
VSPPHDTCVTHINNSNKHQETTATSFPPLSSSDQESSPNAVVFFDSSNINPETYQSLVAKMKELEFLDSDITEVFKRYDEITIKNAIAWATHPENPPKKCYAASIKFACNSKLSDIDFNQKKLTPLERIKKLFKHGEVYNNAECFFNNDYIAFQRGMHQEQRKIDKFFKWQDLIDLCNSFQIKLPEKT